MKALTTRGAALALTLTLALATAAQAVVPGQVDFQGLLLDDAGQPLNGAVTLVFTLYDAPTGGTAQWTESHAAVQVVDGVYDVTLGSQVPLTPALLATANLHLEIQVDGETLSPRRALLAVPYAVRADTAENAENVGGITSVFLTQIVEHYSFDGSDPPNLDPREGVADPDGDGLANFIDPDNDNDGLSDAVELAQGSDLNLVTPTITQVTPSTIEEGQPTPLAVSGTSFDPGMIVTFDGLPVTATNITASSFDVTVTAPTVGTGTLVVTLANGESASSSLVSVIGTRHVFVTATPTDGNLGGIAGADALCQARAVELGVGGPTYLAWLGDSTTSPAARFTHAGPYVRLDGTPIAADFADLTDGTLDAPIVPGQATKVWTNVSAAGNEPGFGQHCQDWTSSSSSDEGRQGQADQTTALWTTLAPTTCDQLAVLYCFEQ